MWIICVDAEYVLSDFFEVFHDKEKAKQTYEELKSMYAEQIEQDTVTIYFTEVQKKTEPKQDKE